MKDKKFNDAFGGTVHSSSLRTWTQKRYGGAPVLSAVSYLVSLENSD